MLSIVIQWLFYYWWWLLMCLSGVPWTEAVRWGRHGVPDEHWLQQPPGPSWPDPGQGNLTTACGLQNILKSMMQRLRPCPVESCQTGCLIRTLALAQKPWFQLVFLLLLVIFLVQQSFFVLFDCKIIKYNGPQSLVHISFHQAFGTPRMVNFVNILQDLLALETAYSQHRSVLWTYEFMIYIKHILTDLINWFHQFWYHYL